MLTASHLPSNRNGLKFFVKEGGLEKKEITQILAIAAQLDKETQDSQIERLSRNKTPTEVDFMSTYSKILVDTIRKSVNAPDL